MAYTKYSLTPANNTATPPDGAPEGMLPSAVNDTMRDMMAQIRDCGDGIRDGTYTMTAPKITGGTITGAAFTGNTFTSPVITGGSINNTPIGASTANTGAFTTLSASGATTFSGATVVSGSLTANTFSSSGATITGGSINSTAIGGSTAAAGAFTTLSASGAFSANGGATLGDASGDALTINSSAVSIPNGLNFDSNTLVIDAANNRVGVGTASPSYALQVETPTATGNTVGYFRQGSGAVALINSTTNLVGFGNSAGSGETRIFADGGSGFVTLRTNSAERMRITSAGDVGIGTSSPANYTGYVNLAINGSSGSNIDFMAGGTAIAFYSAIASGLSVYTSGATYLRFGTNNTERMRIDSSGNVGIGTSSPTYKLTLSGTGVQYISLNSTDTGTGAMGLISLSDDLLLYRGSEGGSGISRSILLNAAATNGTVEFNTAGSERMRITSAGEVLVGGTTELNSFAGGFSLQRTNNAPNFNLYRNDTSVSSGNVLGAIAFWGNDTTSNTPATLAYIYGTASGDHAAGDNPTDLVFGTTPDGSATVAEAGRITQSGAYVLKGGTTTAAAGVGIVFPATQAASADANCLDDYEEGSWTPVVADAATGGNASATTCYGSYTKVGRVVTVTCAAGNIDTTGLTAGNSVFIRGLPFTAYNIPSTTAFYTGTALTSSVTIVAPPVVYLTDATTYVNLADTGAIIVSDITSGAGDIYFTITYEV